MPMPLYLSAMTPLVQVLESFPNTYIQDEDRYLQARNGSDVMYAVSAPPWRRASTIQSSTSEAT